MVRHPWFTGTFLLLWFRGLTFLSILSILINALLTLHLVVGTLLEERKLARAFGESSLDYQKHVSMFFPVKWLISKLFGAR